MTLPKIILDCDPGHDDAVALLLAARHTDLLGVTTVSGNAPLANTTANALLMAQLAELDIAVFAGADAPLVVAPAHAGHVHGDTGLDGPIRPELTRQPAAGDGVDFIIDTVRSTDDVWLVPIGPLTNIALALRQAPDIATKLAGVSLMGGSVGVGNVTAVSEFNFWADPHAAAEVLANDIAPIYMAGLNLTHQLRVTTDTVARLRSGPQNQPLVVSTFIADLFEFYLAACKEHAGEDDAPLHDPCAVMAITHPDLFVFQSGHIAVATDDELSRGMSIWDRRTLPGAPPNCEIALNIDAEAALEVVIEAVSSFR